MTHRYTQDDPIYSSDPMLEELEIEFNSRFDYLSELRAEHEDQFLDEEEAYHDANPEPPYLGPIGRFDFYSCDCAPEDMLPF